MPVTPEVTSAPQVPEVAAPLPVAVAEPAPPENPPVDPNAVPAAEVPTTQ